MLRILLSFLILVFSINLSAQSMKDSLLNSSRPKIGLVLSGGGAKGFAHIGVLKVLEEMNMPIDYISGTSMGSIIGAFYAMGYSASEIEKIVLSQDWESLLKDEISRKYIHVKDKINLDRYVISFPIKPKGIRIPAGIVKGQNIINLFERYTIEYHDKNDFRKFPIPFVCIATDLETGEAVVLDKGNIAEALRASMAIPTVFTPIEINGRLLADGGMINNFPVEEVIKMGADIVIGIDLQTGPRSKDKLNSIEDIINQTVSLMAKREFIKNRKLCDIYIKPNINGYTVADFGKADSLILRGEQIPLEQISELKQIIAKHKLIKTQKQNYPIVTDSTQYFINDIKINGLKHVRKATMLGKLDIETRTWTSIKRIQKGINRAYGSKYFDKVAFQLKGDIEKTLVINVTERRSNRFNVGMHYDDDNKASVLLNTTFQNKIQDGSSLSLDLKLSENPRFTATYNLDNGLKPGYQLKLDINDSEVYDFADGDKVGSYDLKYLKLDANLHSTFRESYSMGIGGKMELYRISSNIKTLGLDETDEDYYFTYYAFINMDSHDKGYYPKKGFSLYGEYKLITNNGLTLDGNERPASVAYLKVQKAIALSNRLTLYPKFFGRVVWGKAIPRVYNTYTGGLDQTNYFDIQVPFVGLRRMEVVSDNSFVFRADIQFELFKKNYLILKPNVAKVVADVNSALTEGQWIKGVGLTYSYNSLVGPMEVTFSLSDLENRLRGFINLGYWF
ncbi:hypothetical protein DWB61_14370 [Ancylomarina euxinus]|uniref:PNPLA domain-containing protein n=2 Tax=Ancylomarina euxinus TaxID=2283627 RepID=A0A425XY72_9BACT|nr:patatin-like phospholipase family protein [Ancylomarina euxinus]MCZ4695965.1 patatin-like phospholipase family protein [Ancylomarina euxinus]MUP16337.1 hypothetical protein [Ancylomarina euxinus]RRG19731.1 hypothetical protein DWB61_14370 [Ancylomarina euxinus]